jgi:hypothetical protein
MAIGCASSVVRSVSRRTLCGSERTRAGVVCGAMRPPRPPLMPMHREAVYLLDSTRDNERRVMRRRPFGGELQRLLDNVPERLASVIAARRKP